MNRAEKNRGCLFGAALGDALGADVEFLEVPAIIKRYPPSGPQTPGSEVTDDTQMMLAVGEALVACNREFSPDRVERELREAFVEWMVSPDNNRAPGMTCMTACRQLARGIPWFKASVPGSKGCGANMRVQPVGLLEIDPSCRAGLAQFQAALTHGHPTALTAADLTAFVIAELISDLPPAELLARMRAYVYEQVGVYHESWLGPLWQRPGEISPQLFIGRGWDECLQVLDRLDQAVKNPDLQADPCEATGDGWIAEEAFATGLLCFLLNPDDPVAAIRRAAVTRGDSDSIACLTGAFAGAAHGLSAWPTDWIAGIEYHDRLDKVAGALG